MSRYVNKNFKPDILIFNIVHNDFDESLFNISQKKNFLQLFYNYETDQFTETVPAFYKSTIRFGRKSALIRYLYINLKANDIEFIRSAIHKQRFEANVDVTNIEDSKNLIYKATDYLIQTILQENSDKRVIFVMDAPRGSIYSGSLEESHVLWMNKMMRDICQKYGSEFLDLTEPMLRDYTVNKHPFNSEADWHWNEYGHKFVADIVHDYLQQNNIIDNKLK